MPPKTENPHNPAPTRNGRSDDTAPAIHARLADLLTRGRENPAVQAARLAEENKALRDTLEKVIIKHEELRAELDKLAAPEHYPGVITAVDDRQSLRVEVHVAGMAPVRAEVHPDVDRAKVRVGMVGHLCRARNCLMDISEDPPRWKEVGVFEEYLDDGLRVLVTHQEQPVALTLADALHGLKLAKGDRIGFDRDGVAMAYARLPAAATEHFFAIDVPEDEFAGLGGLESQIRIIKQAVDFRLKNQEIAARYQVPQKQGILLDGPPGNGKTRLARCVANYLRQLLPAQPCRFMSITGSETYSMWLGGTEAQLKQRFKAAYDAARTGPVVMFFDEIDALGRRRGTDHGSAAPDRILATFLGFLDDVQGTINNVIIIAATNRADQLDPGLTRPGRLDLKLTIPPPNRRAAECVFRLYLSNGLPLAAPVDELVGPLVGSLYSPRSVYAELATVKSSDGRELTVGAPQLVSGALLKHVVQQAALAAAVRAAAGGPDCGVTADDLAAALDSEIASTAALLAPANVKAYVRSIPEDSHPVAVRLAAARRGSYLRSA
jgi:proteasome-associated ATPase